MFRDPEAVLAAVYQGFGGRRVLVAGDLMLDRYLWGRVERISPEAPVPVLRLARESEVAGGAANVARNLIGLGVQVCVAGVTGDDPERAALLRLLAGQGVETDCVIAAAGRRTTTKTRLIGNHQQMLRIDAEETEPVDAGTAQTLFEAIAARLDLSLIHISEPTRLNSTSRMPSSA